MTNAESTSTDSTTERAAKTESQPSLIAVSEENLAALMRATSATSEPEVRQPEVKPPELKQPEVKQPGAQAAAKPEVQQPAIAPVADVTEAPPVVETRRALFASVKEHRSEMLRSAAVPELVERRPAKQSEVKAAIAKRPEAKTSEAKQPEAKQPEAKQPEAKQPEAKQPEAKQPEAKQPETKRPEVKQTEAKQAETKQTEKKRQEYPVAALPSEAAAIQIPPPKAQPVVPTAPAATPGPSRSGLVMGSAGGALILVIGLILLWPKGHAAKPPAAVVAAPKDAAPLQVLAEPLGNGLINVRWNAQSPLVAQARDGRLVITEHDKAARIMGLDAAQLQIGHLTYQSNAESIEFDLEVNDRSGGVAKESVLALSSPAGAAPQAAAIVRQQVTPQAEPPKTQAVVQPPPAPSAPTAAPVPQATPAKARAFVAPPTQQRTEQRAVIDAPPTLANTPATPVGMNLPASLGAVSPPPASPPKQVRVESTLQAANLIKKVVPVYPVLARAAGIQGNVRFTALIGKDGRIQNVKTLSGPRPLVEAASEAVKQWVYRPTLLNGQPMEVITEINVNFTITSSSR